jgi:hypothetical protein
MTCFFKRNGIFAAAFFGGRCGIGLETPLAPARPCTFTTVFEKYDWWLVEKLFDEILMLTFIIYILLFYTPKI